MHSVSVLDPLNTYLVIMEDGTIRKVRAGSYGLTLDGCWTFWKERQHDHRPHGKKLTQLVSIKARHVDTVASEMHIEAEILQSHTKNDKVTTTLRKVHKKPSARPATKANQ